MAKETMKAKIERLEQENKANLELIIKLNNEIAAMQEKTDQSFEISAYKAQLEQNLTLQTEKANLYERRFNQEKETSNQLREKIESFTAEIQQLQGEMNKLNEKMDHKVQNEKKAGRKPKIDEKTIVEMQMYRMQGKTLQEIAGIFGVSYGLVHKHCKMVKNNNSTKKY